MSKRLILSCLIIGILSNCIYSKAIESVIKTDNINLGDTDGAKLSHDRDEIYSLCAEHKDKVLDAYNKVHSNERFQYTISLERYLLNELEKESEKCSREFNKMDNNVALVAMLDSIRNKYGKKIEEIEAVRKEIRNDLDVNEEAYKASLDSVQQYLFLPSIAELESIVGENEYLKVMRRFSDMHKFDISSTRILGKNERCSIRKTLKIKYNPQKMEDGSIFYPANYFSAYKWDGLIVNGKIALQIESFHQEEKEKIESNCGGETYRIKHKPLMAFKLLDLDLALREIKKAEKLKTAIKKIRENKK